MNTKMPSDHADNLILHQLQFLHQLLSCASDAIDRKYVAELLANDDADAVQRYIDELKVELQLSGTYQSVEHTALFNRLSLKENDSQYIMFVKGIRELLGVPLQVAVAAVRSTYHTNEGDSTARYVFHDAYNAAVTALRTHK
jgi:hypothetical protein